MRIFLSDGTEMELLIRHHRTGQPFTTTVLFGEVTPRITGEDLVSLESMARCSEKDQFNKLTGRRLCATRLLEQMREQNYPKADRKLVFDVLCPSFTKSKSNVSP